jgi:uncharacterized protein (DUF1501 family)
MTALRDATADLGEDLNVTQLSAPDFNRTYIFNGEGSHHGWGSHDFVVGGARREFVWPLSDAGREWAGRHFAGTLDSDDFARRVCGDWRVGSEVAGHLSVPGSLWFSEPRDHGVEPHD